MSLTIEELPRPALFPRVWSERDELGYPLLNHECPFCRAMALIINEWDAIECLTCSWREFGPDSPRATFRDWESEYERDAMTDISTLGFQFRGAPVTLMGDGVEELLGRCGESIETGLGLILRTATDTGESDEDGCIFQSRVGGETVWVERFGCTFEQGRHEGGAWSVFLPSER